MKIWKAELILTINMEDKYETFFRFEEQKGNYEINRKSNEWVYLEGWISTRIPMNMTVENHSYNGLKVIQGFNHELTEEELNVLEKNMRDVMIKRLGEDREFMIRQYNRKIKAVLGLC